MNGLEAVVRSALRRYDPVQPPLWRPEPRRPSAPRGRMTAWRKEPDGPDQTVFGDPRGPLDRGERRGVITSRCGAHDVEWAGPGVPCFCCEAGMPGVNNC